MSLVEARCSLPAWEDAIQMVRCKNINTFEEIALAHLNINQYSFFWNDILKSTYCMRTKNKTLKRFKCKMFLECPEPFPESCPDIIDFQAHAHLEIASETATTRPEARGVCTRQGAELFDPGNQAHIARLFASGLKGIVRCAAVIIFLV